MPFGLTDAVAGSLLAFAGIVVTAVCGLLGVLISRSSKQGTGLDALVERLDEAFVEIEELKDREEHCLDALEWAHGRIVVLEEKAGIPRSSRPRVLNRRPLRGR